MKLRILEKKYKRESIFVIQKWHEADGGGWVTLLSHGPYHTLETARESADTLSNPPGALNASKEIIHDYP